MAVTEPDLELDQLRQRVVELEDELRATRRRDTLAVVVGGIAHDFNNILGAVLGFTEIVQARLPPEDPSREHLSESVRVIRRGQAVVQHLLALGQLAGAEPSEVLVNAVDAVDEAVRFARASLPPKVRILLTVPEQGLCVRADISQLQQVVLNLCTNAAQAMEEVGDVHVSVTPVLEGDQPFIKICVDDEGPGIPQASLEHIFEPFFTTKRAGGGAGLGLALVRSVVSRAGGRVLATNTGRGARFEVFWPSLQGGPGPASSDSGIAPSAHISARILVVDDEPALLRIARAHLEAEGADVVAFTSAVEALAELSTTPQAFDLLIADLSMPELSGQELGRRAQSLRPDLPVLLVSGLEGAVVEAVEELHGPRATLTKPYRRRTLLARVTALLG